MLLVATEAAKTETAKTETAKTEAAKKVLPKMEGVAPEAPSASFQLGGQALIEGVMMRSPHYVAAAVRRTDGTITTRIEPVESVMRRHRWLGLPFVRGIVGLCEMMSLGMRFLNWSSSLALQDATPDPAAPPDAPAPPPHDMTPHGSGEDAPQRLPAANAPAANAPAANAPAANAPAANAGDHAGMDGALNGAGYGGGAGYANGAGPAGLRPHATGSSSTVLTGGTGASPSTSVAPVVVQAGMIRHEHASLPPVTSNGGSSAASLRGTVETPEQALLKEQGDALPWWMFVLTTAGSVGVGLFLFVAVPNVLTDWTVGRATHNRILLNLSEGLLKLLIFISYLWLIGRKPDIRRVFEYHGAEHKVVYAAENRCPITPAGARPFDTPHPRCGTGFALLTVVVSIFCFTLLPWTADHLTRVALRLALMPLVAGLSYEVIKLTTHPRWSGAAKWLMTPGMWLQRLTTRQPDDAQLEVSCAAMRAVLGAERAGR